MERLEREITASLDMLGRETVEGAQIMRSSMVASVAGSQRLALVLFWLEKPDRRSGCSSAAEPQHHGANQVD